MDMTLSLTPHQGTIRPSLIAQLERLTAPERSASTYYLNINVPEWGNAEGPRIADKDVLAEARKQIDQLDVSHAGRQALHHDRELVEEFALATIGQRHTSAIACFLASEEGFARAVRLPWPVRSRFFFYDHFVLWPLRQLLEQADRYALALTDKDDARVFLYFAGQIEEISSILDVIPGKIRFPDPYGELKYRHKHTEHYHRHFAKVAQAVLRHFETESFECLIIGGLWETLHQFESYLHDNLRERIIARWDIDVHASEQETSQRARQEEQKLLEHQAETAWQAIQDLRAYRGALGPGEVLPALWQRRVQTLLIEPSLPRAGFRCQACDRLNTASGPCVECGGQMVRIPDLYEEACHQGVEQNAQVRYWKNPHLHAVESIAAMKRF